MKKKIDPPPKTVGSVLKTIRERNRYSKEELAQLTGSNVERIEDWESDKIEPTISECLILSRLYAIPVDDMFCSADVLSQVPDAAAFERVTRINRLAHRWYE